MTSGGTLILNDIVIGWLDEAACILIYVLIVVVELLPVFGLCFKETWELVGKFYLEYINMIGQELCTGVLVVFLFLRSDVYFVIVCPLYNC